MKSVKAWKKNKKILIISARGKIEKHLKEIIFTKDISIVGIDLGEDKVFSSDYDFSYEKEDLEGICNFFEVVLE